MKLLHKGQKKKKKILKVAIGKKQISFKRRPDCGLVVDSKLPLQGAWVRSLVRELEILRAASKTWRSQIILKRQNKVISLQLIKINEKKKDKTEFYT